jgi:hypothetical protein
MGALPGDGRDRADDGLTLRALDFERLP